MECAITLQPYWRIAAGNAYFLANQYTVPLSLQTFKITKPDLHNET
jgi:hypothetical protein